MKNQLFNGDSEEVLRGFPDQTFDACVCDPPYGLGTKEPTGPEIDAYLAGDSRLDTGGDFMGKSWDIPRVALWREVYRTMRDGGLVMAFAGTRTLDLMAAGIEAAGFRYIGTLAWMHGQGFPKSLNIGKAIDKKGPDEKRIRYPDFGAYYAQKRQASGLTHNQICEKLGSHGNHNHGGASSNWENGLTLPTIEQMERLNVLLGLETDRSLWPMAARKEYEREIVGVRPVHAGVAFTSDGPTELPITKPATLEASKWEGWGTALKPAWEPVLVFSRGMTEWQMPSVPFFYCAKAVKSEKNLEGEVENNHVTVKPQKLMEWLVGLAVPKGGLVLEPFLGSGTTAVACAEQGRFYVGIERDPEYFRLASQRVSIVQSRADEIAGQRAMFDLMSELPEE